MSFNDSLISKVKNTESQSNIKEKISDNINESKKILQYFRKEYGEGSKKYKEILKEYNELRQQIEKSIKSDNKITKIELNLLHKEYNDIKELESYLDYIDRKTNQSIKEVGKIGLNKISNMILSGSNEDLLENIDSINFFLNIPDEKLKKIKILLDKDPNGNDPTIRLEVSNIMYKHVINIPGLKSIFNTAQNKLINKIMGKNNFNQKYIKGYDGNSMGNFILEIEFISDYLQNTSVEEINSQLLVNYINFLTKDSGKLDIKSLIVLFGKGTLFKLGELWEKKGSKNIAKNAIIDNGGESIIKMIEIFSSPEAFLSNIGKLNKEEQDIAMQYLKQNLQNIKDKFKNKLNKEIKSHNPNIPEIEIENSIEELLNNLGKVYENQELSFDKKLKEVYLQFGELNKKYKNCLDIKEQVNKINNIQKNENELKLIQEKINYSKTDNIKEKEKILRNIKEIKLLNKEIQTINNINNLTNNDTISKIISGEINYDKYITELRTQNEELDKQIQEVEKEKLEYKNKENKKETIEKLNTIDSQSHLHNLYYIKTIPEQNGENNTLIINGKEITGITGKEYNSIIETNNKGKIIIKNPEALKNLINIHEKLKELNLGFVWKFRNELIQIMNQLKGTSGINTNDNNFIDKSEFNKLLNFILEVIGEKGNPNSINGTYEKIRKINGGGMLNNKKDTFSGLSVIGQKFESLGYIQKGGNSFDIENKNNLLNYKNILREYSM